MSSSPPPEIKYRFNDQELTQLRPYGTVHGHEVGDVLFREGDKEVDLCVVLSGQLDINIVTQGDETRVGWMEAGQFAGDISVLTGQTSLATGHMAVAGEVLHIRRESFLRLLVENSRLSDILVTAFTARRSWARAMGRSAVTVIGAPLDRQAFAIRDLLTKHGVPHAFLDAADDPVAQRLLETRGLSMDDLPVVLRGQSTVLKAPDLIEVGNAFGLDPLPDGARADVIVVGAGPAGLAASVYAASEGLSVLTLDMDAPGGQAGTSSKIENYLGFPTGISGRDLAERATIQAQKFGARIVAPTRAEALEKDGDDYCMTLHDGRKLRCRAVVLAMGAQYRRLPIENLEYYEGRGVYYGATAMEAQICGGADVCVVGAGNSAGQGAVFLAQTAANVHVLYRRDDIRETMSEYLVRRLEETPNIHLHRATEIARLNGCEDRLHSVDLVQSGEGGVAPLETPFVFLFIGAQPRTAWLPQTMASDARGFLKTGTDVANLELVKAGWTLDRMPSRYETSWPRIYAVGDVRTGSVKRVASGVGEGSVVVSDIHKAIADISGQATSA